MGWWVRNPEVVCTELEDGAVLLNMETRTYYSLNRAALGIWQLVDSVGNIEDLCGELAGRFELSAEQAPALVSGFLQKLVAGQLVSEADGETPRAAAPAATSVAGEKSPFADPELIEHDEPLHEIPLAPFDPQLPLAE